MSTAQVPATPSPMAPAASSVEARLAQLAEAVARLEARVATLEGAAPLVPVPLEAILPPGPTPVDAALPSPVRIMGLIGRVCLTLGGATFIRAMVDAGTVHRGWGVALGLAYAVTWALLALRAKTPLDGGFHALASILITYPLLVESTARFRILTPGLAALLLLAVTALHGAVALRRNLQSIIWAATLASLGAGFAIMTARQALEPFIAVFLALGLGTLWLNYKERWQGLRWPVALAADLGVLILTSLAVWPGGPPEAYKGISRPGAMAFALGLAVIYLGAFAIRMFRRRRVVGAFEGVQSALVLAAGVGGTLRIAVATGSGAGLLGAGVAGAGCACYLAARPFAEDQAETRANFNFFTFLGLVLLLLGGAIFLPGSLFGPLSGALGLASMAAGGRLQRGVLFLQSGIYLAVAALASGLTAWSLHAFLDPSGVAAGPSWPGLFALAVLTATLVLFRLRRPPEAVARRIQPVILVLGAMAALGFGAGAIQSIHGLATASSPDLGILAAIRTGVLSALIVALAWCGRKWPDLELRWLVYPMMIVTALKFLFEDVAVGRPLTLFLGFMCYGATLMFAPRLLKAPAPPADGGGTGPSLPEVDS